MPERVAILGAGAMGSALTAPAVDAGNDVALWGTWLDDELVAAAREGRPHPRTGVPVDERVRVHGSGGLEEALRDATVVVLAITSDGVQDVLRRARPHLAPGAPVLVTTKGFGRDGAGRVQLLPALLAADLPPGSSVVGLGGPCKANEVAARRPTATVYGGEDPQALERARATLATARYAVATTDDLAGLELAAAMKNVYAIALGVCQGLAAQGGEPWHNLQAAAFAQATREMAALAEALDGRAETVHGLAGAGDLEVTGLSGRNRVYGERLGRGEGARAALAAMEAAGQAVEGVPAARLAARLARERGVEAVPLLQAVVALLDGAPDPAELVAAASLPQR